MPSTIAFTIGVGVISLPVYIVSSGLKIDVIETAVTSIDFESLLLT